MLSQVGFGFAADEVELPGGDVDEGDGGVHCPVKSLITLPRKSIKFPLGPQVGVTVADVEVDDGVGGVHCPVKSLITLPKKSSKFPLGPHTGVGVADDVDADDKVGVDAVVLEAGTHWPNKSTMVFPKKSIKFPLELQVGLGDPADGVELGIDFVDESDSEP